MGAGRQMFSRAKRSRNDSHYTAFFAFKPAGVISYERFIFVAALAGQTACPLNGAFEQSPGTAPNRQAPLPKIRKRRLPVWFLGGLQRVVHAARKGAEAAADQCADAGAAPCEGRNARTGQRAAGSSDQGILLGT